VGQGRDAAKGGYSQSRENSQENSDCEENCQVHSA
jgi:hypothetical protein